MRTWVLLLGVCACIGNDPNLDESSSFVKKDKDKKCKPHKKHQDCGSATQPVSVEGGEVTTDSGLTLDIPYGALDGTTTITVTTTDQTQPGATTPVYEFGPEGTVFAKPVTVTLPFTGTSGTVYWSRLDGTGFDPIGGVIDPVAHTITAETFHFSLGYVGPAVTTRTVSGGASNTYISASLRQNQLLPIADGEVEAIVSDGNGGFASLPGTGGTGTFTIPNVPANGDYILHYGSNYMVTSSNTPDLGFLTPGRPDLVPITAETLVDLTVDNLESWEAGDALEWFSTEANDWDFDTERLANIPDASTSATLPINIADVDAGPASEIHGADGYRAAIGQLTQHSTATVQYLAMTRVAQFPSTFSAFDGTSQALAVSLADVSTGNTLSLDYRGGDFKAVLDTYGNPNHEPIASCAGGLCGGFAGALAQAYSATDGFYGANADLLLMFDDSGLNVVTGPMAYANTTALGGQWGVLFDARWSYRTIQQLPGTSGRAGAGAGGFPDALEWTTSIATAQSTPIVPKLLPPANVQVNGASYFAGGGDLGGTATLTWTNPNPVGSLQPLYYTIDVIEMYVDAQNRSHGVRAASITTEDTSFTFPPNQIIQAGHAYVFQITATTSTSGDSADAARLATSPFKSSIDIATAMLSSGIFGDVQGIGAAQLIQGELRAPLGTAVNATSLFWAERGDDDFGNIVRNSGSIWMSDLDGSNPHIIASGQDVPYKLVVAGNTLYWINTGDDVTGTVVSLDLADPNAAPQLVSANEPYVSDIIEYAGDVFWISGNGTTRARGGTLASVSPIGGTGVATDGTNLFYAIYGDGNPGNTGKVLGTPIAGGPVTTYADQQPQTWGVKTDGTYVYFSNQSWQQGDTATINRVPIDNSAPVEVLHEGPQFLKNFAIDATYIYYVENRIIWRLSKAGGTPEKVIGTPTNCIEANITVTANALYYGDVCSSGVYRAPL